MTIFPAWLQSSWDFLLERKKNKTLPHALLFTGNKGVGKYQLSVAFSRYLLCHTEQSCGQCHGCVLFSAGHHPDFFVLMPEEHGQIKIDQIRQITEKLNYTAQQGSYRIVVIKEAHAMNTAAANALLKTLEEPGEKTLLMLTTASESFLPPTIRSRCQVLKIKADPVIAKTALISQGLSEKESLYFLDLSDNAPLAALEFSKSNYLTRREIIFKKIEKATVGKESVIALAHDLLEEPLDEVLLLFQLAFMELIKVKTNFKTAEELKNIAEKFSLKKLFSCYNFIINLRLKINSNVNLNAQLLLENIFLKIRQESVHVG